MKCKEGREGVSVRNKPGHEGLGAGAGKGGVEICQLLCYIIYVTESSVYE